MRPVIIFSLLLSLFAADLHSMNQSEVLLKARYSPVQGSDPEYGQGAIERNELAHREIEHFVWLILVDAPGDTAEWSRKLNAAVEREHGSFTVERATADEVESVRSGKVTLQR